MASATGAACRVSSRLLSTCSFGSLPDTNPRLHTLGRQCSDVIVGGECEP